jgi:CheY-like chemotaxis protein
VTTLIRLDHASAGGQREFNSNIANAGRFWSNQVDPARQVLGSSAREMEKVMVSLSRTPLPTVPVLDCLLVDDDPLIRLCVETMVRTAGHLVTSAEDGAQAVRILSGHQFDVVISDIRMPNLDGWGLFDHVRRSSPGTDVILMTAYATAPDAIKALTRGACEYLPKPLDADELSAHLRHISERRAGKAAT